MTQLSVRERLTRNMMIWSYTSRRCNRILRIMTKAYCHDNSLTLLFVISLLYRAYVANLILILEYDSWLRHIIYTSSRCCTFSCKIADMFLRLNIFPLKAQHVVCRFQHDLNPINW